MKLLKICCSKWVNESRDYRELGVYSEEGAEISVLVKGDIGDKPKKDIVEGFEVLRYTTKPFGEKAPSAFNKLISLFQWANFARKQQPDIISGHDLLALTIGWLSTFFTINKPKLIYDSHEFEIGRNADRSGFSKWLVLHWEQFMIKRSTLTIVVNKSIADEVAKLYELDEKPTVVRNIPISFEVDESECKKVKKQYLEKLGVEKLLIYHGLVCSGRGIESTIEALSMLESVGLVVVGNPDSPEYLEKLRQMTRQFNVEKMVDFHDAVPHEVLWKFVGAADLGIVMIAPVSKSYYYALPNKLFECIQSGVPVIGSDLPEIKKVVVGYNVGALAIPDNAASIAEAVKGLICDQEAYDSVKSNVELAKKQLCWENEKVVLAKAFNKISQ